MYGHKKTPAGGCLRILLPESFYCNNVSVGELVVCFYIGCLSYTVYCIGAPTSISCFVTFS